MSRPWWQTAVIYQIYPRSFQDTTGNGVGDLRGITRRLDYLAATLGIDAIWISPFYPSPMADFGYDVADYCDVDPLFGSLEDFDDLVRAAHERNLEVIIDWVPNHTSEAHRWFQESRSSRSNPKRDWYVWADALPDGSPPNNWQSVFGGSAWEWDEATGQYYLHSFLPEQPDLAWRNPEVEQAMLDTLRFWLDRDVDGFRIDVAHYMMKHPELLDNPLAKPETGAMFKDMGDYGRWDHVHSKGHTDVHDVFRKVRAVLDAYPGDRYAVGEIHEFDWPKWASYYGAALDELHQPFNFSLLFAPWIAAEWRARIEDMHGVLPPGAWPCHVLGNHDEVRLTDRLGPHHARAAAVLLLTLRGTPTLYYGDELGMRQADIPSDVQQDPWGIRVPGQGRDGCRTPMRWTSAAGAGFCEPDVAPWLPIGDDLSTVNVAVQIDDPSSMLNLYRRLISLRRSSPALRHGDQTMIDAGPEVLAYVRRSDAEAKMVAVNYSNRPVSLDLPTPAELVLTTSAERQPGGDLGRFVLDPNEAVVLALR